MRLCHRLLLPCRDFIDNDETAIALGTGRIPTDYTPFASMTLRITTIEDKIHIVQLAYP